MQHPDARAEELASRLAIAHAEALALFIQATETELTLVTEAEGWPVLLVGHHLALWYPQQGHWLRAVAAGHAVTTTPADLDAVNAQMVAHAARLTRANVMAELRANGAALEGLIRRMTAQELATSAPVGLAGGRPMTVADIITQIVVAHLAEHVPHMRAALGRS